MEIFVPTHPSGEINIKDSSAAKATNIAADIPADLPSKLLADMPAEQPRIEYSESNATFADPIGKRWLTIAPSTIEGAGDGVFARRFIPENTIVCTYHGLIIDSAKYDSLNKYEKDRSLRITGCDSVVITNDVGSKINDIVRWGKWSKTNLNNFMMTKKMPVNLRYKTHGPPLEYNVIFVPYEIESNGNQIKTMALRTIKRIKKEEELFVDYGYNYWTNRMTSAGLISESEVRGMLSGLENGLKKFGDLAKMLNPKDIAGLSAGPMASRGVISERCNHADSKLHSSIDADSNLHSSIDADANDSKIAPQNMFCADIPYLF